MQYLSNIHNHGSFCKTFSPLFMWTPPKIFPLWVGHTLSPWQHDSLCACVSRVGYVYVNPFFLFYFLGAATNHWFCIRCDWSLRGLIHFRLPN